MSPPSPKTGDPIQKMPANKQKANRPSRVPAWPIAAAGESGGIGDSENMRYILDLTRCKVENSASHMKFPLCLAVFLAVGLAICPGGRAEGGTSADLVQAALLANGAIEPVTKYPLRAVPPSLSGAREGWIFQWKLPDKGPFGEALFSAYFAKYSDSLKGAVALDVYLLPGLPKPGEAPPVSEGNFLGTGVVFLNGKMGAVQVQVDFSSMGAGQTVTLLFLPVGDPSRSPALPLAGPPKLDICPAPAPLAEIFSPLWKGADTSDEAVIFFRDSPEATAKARLLHKPKKIVRVHSYETGKDYVEGADWKIAGDGSLVAVAGSSLPTVIDSELHPAEENPAIKTFKTVDGRNLFSAETWNHKNALFVTYRHDDDWSGPRPALAEKELPRTLAKLRAGEPLGIVFTGDSITVGASATSRSLLPPFLPRWADLVTGLWRTSYPSSHIQIKNRALGGMIARWGAENADMLIAPEKPDLCLIAFGMNDRGALVPVEKFKAQIEQIMAAARKGNPDVEFILVSSIRNNPEWGPSKPLDEYHDALKSLQGTGVAFVDMTALHSKLLERKPYIDMSGNNVNHPNDYLVRWYAQMIGGLLAPPPESK